MWVQYIFTTPEDFPAHQLHVISHFCNGTKFNALWSALILIISLACVNTNNYIISIQSQCELHTFVVVVRWDKHYGLLFLYYFFIAPANTQLNLGLHQPKKCRWFTELSKSIYWAREQEIFHFRIMKLYFLSIQFRA